MGTGIESAQSHLKAALFPRIKSSLTWRESGLLKICLSSNPTAVDLARCNAHIPLCRGLLRDHPKDWTPGPFEDFHFITSHTAHPDPIIINPLRLPWVKLSKN